MNNQLNQIEAEKKVVGRIKKENKFNFRDMFSKDCVEQYSRHWLLLFFYSFIYLFGAGNINESVFIGHCLVFKNGGYNKHITCMTDLSALSCSNFTL